MCGQHLIIACGIIGCAPPTLSPCPQPPHFCCSYPGCPHPTGAPCRARGDLNCQRSCMPTITAAEAKARIKAAGLSAGGCCVLLQKGPQMLKGQLFSCIFQGALPPAGNHQPPTTNHTPQPPTTTNHHPPTTCMHPPAAQQAADRPAADGLATDRQAWTAGPQLASCWDAGPIGGQVDREELNSNNYWVPLS